MNLADRLAAARIPSSEDIEAADARVAAFTASPDELPIIPEPVVPKAEADPYAYVGGEVRTAHVMPFGSEAAKARLERLRGSLSGSETPALTPVEPAEAPTSTTSVEIPVEASGETFEVPVLHQAEESVPATTPYVGRHRADTPVEVSPVDARQNWNDMMTREREVTAAKDAALQAAYAPKTSDLLNDSELVQDHRARRNRTTASPLTKFKHARDVRKMDKDFQKLQNQHVKETKAFDKAAAKERAFQTVEDNAVLKATGRQDRLEDKLFQKRLAAEAKLKAKQDKKLEYARGKELAKIKRDKLFGGIAARASLRFGRR